MCCEVQAHESRGASRTAEQIETPSADSAGGAHMLTRETPCDPAEQKVWRTVRRSTLIGEGFRDPTPAQLQPYAGPGVSPNPVNPCHTNRCGLWILAPPPPQTASSRS